MGKLTWNCPSRLETERKPQFEYQFPPVEIISQDLGAEEEEVAIYGLAGISTRADGGDGEREMAGATEGVSLKKREEKRLGLGIGLQMG